MIFDSAMDTALVADVADVTKPRPYESDRARTAAVYGLPLQVAEPRVLEVRAPLDGEARLFGSSCIARVTTGGPVSSACEGPFDLIVLHRTLDRLFCAQGRDRALRGSAELLRWAASMLSPAGAVVGSVSNHYAGWHPGFWGRKTAECAGFAARHCEDLLTSASLRRPEIFGIHPSADSPRTLLSLQAQNYRQHALRELDRQASALSVAGYLLRAAWHVTGLGRHLHRDLMFWAFRA